MAHQSWMTFTFRDVNGDQETMRLRTWINDTDTLSGFNTNSQTVETAVGVPGHLSNAKMVGRGLSILIDAAQGGASSTNPPLNAWFTSVSDKALLSFSNASGYHRNIYLPAPIEAAFVAPPTDMRVNAAQAAVAALITAIEGLITDPTTGPLNLYTGGTYSGRKRHRNKPLA